MNDSACICRASSRYSCWTINPGPPRPWRRHYSPRSRLGRSSSARRLTEQGVAVQQGLADGEQLLPRPLRLIAQLLERGAVVEAVALHEDPLRALDHCTARERTLELLRLAEAPQRHVERAAQGVAVERRRVREDARLRRLRD